MNKRYGRKGFSGCRRPIDLGPILWFLRSRVLWNLTYILYFHLFLKIIPTHPTNNLIRTFHTRTCSAVRTPPFCLRLSLVTVALCLRGRTLTCTQKKRLNPIIKYFALFVRPYKPNGSQVRPPKIFRGGFSPKSVLRTTLRHRQLRMSAIPVLVETPPCT